MANYGQNCVSVDLFRHFKWLILLLITIFSNFPQLVRTQDVLGCGGFVKSEIPIDFARVEVKLYTKQGSLKYQTDCAPNNGYYLIPVYDKGDYVLKVEPPEGWIFDPTSVSLHIDGSTDSCSQSKDLNFYFKGFSLYGQVVSRGSTVGPSKIDVKLARSSEPNTFIFSTTTDSKGKFRFSNIQQDDYIVVASHPELKFDRQSAKIQVAKDNGKLAETLVISGYEVTGSVLGDDREPVRGVHFILFGDPDPNLAPQNCKSGLPPGYDPKLSSVKKPMEPLCHVESSQNGRFVFPVLVPGKYVIVSFYRSKNIKFDVVPSNLEVTVQHQSMSLSQEFKVEGFSVSGRVLTTENGRGLPGASLLINGKKITETKENGIFHLENMRAGSYDIQIVADKIQFSLSTVKIHPNTPNLPDIVASAFEVCGHLEGDSEFKAIPRKIVVKSVDRTDRVDSNARSDENGKFCLWLSSGTYEATIDTKEDSDSAKIIFKPSVLRFTVKDSPVSNIKFHQFKAKIEGKVDCLEDCDKAVRLILRSAEADQQTVMQRSADITSGKFLFTDVLPGKYELIASNDAWCWQDRVKPVTIVNDDLNGIIFKHTGYLLTVLSTHSTILQYKLDSTKNREKSPPSDKSSKSASNVTSSPPDSGKLSVNKGVNKLCLEVPGTYRLTPVGCHIFSSDHYDFNTANSTDIILEASRHFFSGTVISDLAVSDVRVAIKTADDGSSNNQNGEEAIIGPLTATKRSDKGDYEYVFTYWAVPHKTIDLQPLSDELLFYPDKKRITILDECMQYAVEFMGKKGLFLDGYIKPPLAGVKVTVVARDGSIKPIVLETSDNGRYRVGPLHGHTKYDITAEKQGYILSRDKELGHFTAFKLAEITVSVVEVDTDTGTDRPLSGVIISLSGGTDYRQNKLTQEDGKMLFTELGPGQYFLRAMMKEFQFDPPSKIVEVSEGGIVSVTLKGKRVAFSCFGTVTSLTGEPESGVVIEAVGTKDCENLQEEVTTETGGNFRLRGLKPNCDYEVRLKRSADVNKHIERSTPRSRLVHVSDGDVHDVKLIVFRPLRTMDISGNVITSKEYLSSLKIRLTSETVSSDLVYPLGQSSFFQFMSLSIDGRYYTLSLESTLSRSSYDYVLPPEITFRVNESYRHFLFEFKPKPYSSEHDSSQGSYFALPLAVLLFVIISNHSRILPFASKALEMLSVITNQAVAAGTGNRDEHSNTGSVFSVSAGASDLTGAATKKKLKPRKVQ